MHPLLLTPVATAGRLVLRLLAATYRLRDAPTTTTRLADLRPPAILAWWHNQSGPGLPLVLELRRRGWPIAVLASPSQDGELAARAARGLGLIVVRGSASRGGREGLRALHRAVVREGCSPLILPDGPRGPQYQAKPGIVVLAQTTGLPIVPMGFAVRSPWHLGSWDHMEVPRPGSRIAVTIGPAITVPRELGENERIAMCVAVKDAIDACRA
jgi:hypothetical protein